MSERSLRLGLTVDIRFFVDGKAWVQRRWPQVPRAGDEVMLGSKGDKTAFRVVRVVWGVEADEYPISQSCNVELIRAADAGTE